MLHDSTIYAGIKEWFDCQLNRKYIHKKRATVAAKGYRAECHEIENERAEYFR